MRHAAAWSAVTAAAAVAAAAETAFLLLGQQH